MGKNKRRLEALVVTLTILTTSLSLPQMTHDAKAENVEIGSLAAEVTGNWSYWDGSKTVVQTNAMLLDKLPTTSNKGTYRWTTENYDESTGAVDVGGWSTSMLWNYSSNSFGDSVYAIPLSYKATSGGVYVTKPSTIIVEDDNKYTSTLFMNQPEDGSLSDFVIGTDYSFDSTKVDSVSEWSTDVVMENPDNRDMYMKMTMTQGSPFAFFELYGSKEISIKRHRSLPSKIVYYNGDSLEESTMIVVRTYDNQDLVSGYSDYDYYAFYLSEGSSIKMAAASDGYADNAMGDLTVEFADEDSAYMTMAYLCESSGTKDDTAINYAKEYQKYAYNFITDTKTSFVYDRSAGKVITTYEYTLDEKEESTSEDTLMGILPHQYKNMSGYDFIDNTTRSIRGTIKYIVGTNYSTELTYSGILTAMPSVDASDRTTLQSYVDSFMEEYGPTEDSLTKETYDENTYDTGKKLNRAIQVMEAAEECGDTVTADILLKAVEKELADWFTADGEEDDKYFYYDEEVGSLFGFPQSYYTVDGMTDHHFHYGYFINAAAQVALRDKSFAEKYGNIVSELIGDIANYERNDADQRYPFLRYFSTYEGHSWASGHANFADGNNQESSSEAINAWAGLILWGQATGNEDLTDLGVYLYQTEISAVNAYWFDVDGDVLDAKFKKTATKDSSLPKYSSASMVWGGKYTYAAWWTAEPYQIQGINLLPMTAASFYQSKNADFILENVKTAQLKEDEYGGDDKSQTRWNELWSEYLALASPEDALDLFDDSCSPEAGDSKAHAYHYIMALEKAGSPDLTITCDNPLSSVFVDEDGNKTYVVYNADDVENTVTFSDGTTVNAEPGKATTVSEAEIAGKAKYTINHYLQNLEGGYDLISTTSKTAKLGSTVSATANEYSGYVLDETVEGSLTSGIVTEEGLVLNLYYNMTEVREKKAVENDSLYTKLGTVSGKDISYYLLKNDMGVAVKLLDNGQTFYVEYSGVYTKTNTTASLNQKDSASNLYTGVYKLSTGTFKNNSYSTIKLVSGDKMTYIIVKCGEPAEAPDISDYGIETESGPTNPLGLAVGCSLDNTITLIFRASNSQIEKGQTFNIYLDDTLIYANVSAGSYSLNEVSAGRHTVKVTGVCQNEESSGVEASVKVSGEVYKTTSNPETSTEEATTNQNTEIESSSEVATSEAEISTENSSDSEITSSNDKETNSVYETTKNSDTTTTGKIVVKKVKFKFIGRKGKKAKIRLRNTGKVTRYVVRISTKKNFKKARTIIKTRRGFVIKKLKKNQIYYIKVRAVKIINGKKYKGKWSNIRRIKKG